MHSYTHVMVYAVISNSYRYTHTHMAFYTNASCVTARLSHMIELATVEFCGFFAILIKYRNR